MTKALSPSTNGKFAIADFLSSHDDGPFNQLIAPLNQSRVQVCVFQGAYPFHKHDDVDELFYVAQGMLYLDMEEETLALNEGEGIVVPRGVAHRTRTPERAVVLMVAAPEAPCQEN